LRRRFFVNAFAGSSACLTGDVAHHLGRVLRAETGQLYELSDGTSVFLARIIGVSTDRIDFSLLEKLPNRASPLQISILLSIVRFERFEWALEKATELGVNTVVPVAAARSEKALVSAAAKRIARWRKILLESAQQARCLRPPLIDPVKQVVAAFAENAASLKVLFSERPAAVPAQAVFKEAASKMEGKVVPPAIALAIGPEGGWTDGEFAAASAAGFREACLGENILRTETAVIAGLAAANLYFQGFGQTPVEGANPDFEGAAPAESPATGTSR
jgi:16S rRNA (uracil1498-N3)-methyltransferase